MLRRRKRIFSNFLITKPLTSHHLLHSDKSTYFYKNHHHTFHPKSQGNAQVGITKLSVFSSRFQVIPLAVSVAALLGLGIALVSPLAKSAERVYAEDTSELNQYSSIAVSMSNSSLGELTGGETVSTKVTPGLISYIDNNIKITTKRINQFYVTVQAAENSTSELVGEAYNAMIDPVADGGVKPDSFGNNTWGYTIGDPEVANEDLSYHPLTQYSAAATPLYTSASNLADGEYNLKLVFAAKINANKPSDHYKTSTLVSVAADAKGIPTWDNITDMQEMTSDICNATPAPTAEDIKNKTYEEIITATPSKQLKDSRDGKYYWISKLADGNCWMTQNLDFDIPATLSSEDTDITYNDDGSIRTAETGISGSTEITKWFNYNDVPRYHDPGDYYYKGPDGKHSQDSTRSCTDITGSISDNSSCNNLVVRTVANNDPAIISNQNARYHIGNYYNWLGATVNSGNGLSVRGGQASDSICPKGWELPKSGNAADKGVPYNTDKTFAKLFEDYGWTWGEGHYSNGLNGGTNYNIYAAPFYFTFSGTLYSSTLYSIGHIGDLWSSTASSNGSAFYFHFISPVYPANDSNYFFGYSVRCVAR